MEQEGISTHSLTKRLTGAYAGSETEEFISTHSLTKRLTFCLKGVRADVKYFNSQPHEEADDLGTIKQPHKDMDFNSQPHEEADKILTF